MYDVIVVGAGPAGLSAALVLGRSRRRVLICEDDRHRNDSSSAVHAFLTRDGIHPAELRRIGREQLEPYGVEYRIARVTTVVRRDGGFALTFESGDLLRCRRLLLATGIVDHMPEIEGIDRFYGSSVFHCPYCDGWEMRDRVLVASGRGAAVAGLALSLKTWSPDVTVCTNGPSGIPAADLETLRRLEIRVRTERIARLDGADGHLERIIFADGTDVPCEGIFLHTGQDQRCDLARQLGCKFNRKGTVMTGKLEGTGIPGLWVAGDASRDVQLAIVAAAEGAKAAIAINTDLQKEDNR